MRDFRLAASDVAIYKSFNPIYRFIRKMTGIKNFTSWQKKVTENGQNIRRAILKHITERKSGKNQSLVKGDADLLSLFL